MAFWAVKIEFCWFHSMGLSWTRERELHLPRAPAAFSTPFFTNHYWKVNSNPESLCLQIQEILQFKVYTTVTSFNNYIYTLIFENRFSAKFQFQKYICFSYRIASLFHEQTSRLVCFRQQASCLIPSLFWSQTTY